MNWKKNHLFVALCSDTPMFRQPYSPYYLMICTLQALGLGKGKDYANIMKVGKQRCQNTGVKTTLVKTTRK